MGLLHLKEYGVTLKRLRVENHLQLPVLDVPWEDKAFKTPSGKYEFTASAAKQKGYDGRIAITFPKESSQQNPELAKEYPYSLLSLHPLRSNHSQHYHLIPGIQRIKIEISADIALEKNIEENDKVKVYNARGQLTGNVKIMKKAHPKTINIDEGNWQVFGGSVNQLTSNGESDNGLGSILYDCLVNIEKC